MDSSLGAALPGLKTYAFYILGLAEQFVGWV